MLICLMKHPCPGTSVKTTSISVQSSNMVPSRFAERIDNPHSQWLSARFRFRKRVPGRGMRRLLRVGFGCLEKLQRLAYTNAPRPSLRGRFERHIRFALRLIQETRNGTFIRVSPMPAVIEKRVGAEIVMRSQRGSLRRFLHGLSFSASVSILGNEPIRF